MGRARVWTARSAWLGLGLALVLAVAANAQPAPPGAGGLPRPAEAGPADLKVLDWAGFKAAVSYSFDDAQPSQIEHWRELAATGEPMTAYIALVGHAQTPDFDQRWREVGQAGWELGDHTIHHCHFNELCQGLTRFDAAAEIDQDRDFIINTLGAPGVWTLAYPYGDLGYEPEAARHVFIARGVMAGSIAPHAGDPFNLPTYVAKAGDTEVDFDQVLEQSRGQGHWLIYTLHSLLPTTANWYAGVEISGVVATIEHAKRDGDLWIDTVANVGAYWRGQSVVEAAVGPTARTTKPITWTWTAPPHFPPGRKLRVTVDGGVLSQNGRPLAWNSHGYYEVDLDAGALSWRP